MKKIFFLAALLLSATSVFTACEDDRDSNPTLVDVKGIVLNTPPYATELFDLQRSKDFRLTWSQPVVTDNNAPLAGHGFYAIQFSKDGNFTTSFEQASKDESGATVADFIQLDETFSTCDVALYAANVNKALMKLYKWEEGTVPASVEFYVRVVGTFAGDNSTAAPGVQAVSNVLKMKAAPYYVELKDAAPNLWYLVGNLFADGTWGASADKVGLANVPMFPIDGFEYNKKTGAGSFTYTDYFRVNEDNQTDEFKILTSAFNWQYGMADTNQDGKPEYLDNKDGGLESNIKMPKSGYYTLTVDGVKNELTIAPAKGIEKAVVYKEIGLIGLNGDWNKDVDMTPVNTKARENHIWMVDIDVPANTEAKFRANHSWDAYDWGKAAFPYGQGTKGGANIPVKKGSYKVFFNDLTGDYHFIAK